jgi:hypothetical protein
MVKDVMELDIRQTLLNVNVIIDLRVNVDGLI